MSVSRDPSDYSPTTHAGQRAKERGIDFRDVARTIEDGEVRQSHKPNCRLFVKEFEQYDAPVGVVANAETGEVITVAYREE